MLLTFDWLKLIQVVIRNGFRGNLVDFVDFVDFVEDFLRHARDTQSALNYYPSSCMPCVSPSIR